MARSYTGKFRGKSDKKLVGEARRLRSRLDLSYTELARVMSEIHPEIEGGVSNCAVWQWCNNPPDGAVSEPDPEQVQSDLAWIGSWAYHLGPQSKTKLLKLIKNLKKEILGGESVGDNT